MPVLLYGEYNGKRAVWLRGILIEKFESEKPVAYWLQNPTGYPYQVRLKLIASSPERSNAITKEEFASVFGLGVARQKIDQWSLVVFGEEQEGVTYSSALFAKINDESQARNVIPVIAGTCIVTLCDSSMAVGFLFLCEQELWEVVPGLALHQELASGQRRLPNGPFPLRSLCQVNHDLVEVFSDHVQRIRVGDLSRNGLPDNESEYR